jgi:hypothetical protein
MILIVAAVVIFALLILGPQAWVRWTMATPARQGPD